MDDSFPNFKLNLFVDGLESPIEVAPVGEAGGFTLFILQRDSGAFAPPHEISGRADGNELLFEVRNRNGIVVLQSRTTR